MHNITYKKQHKLDTILVAKTQSSPWLTCIKIDSTLMNRDYIGQQFGNPHLPTIMQISYVKKKKTFIDKFNKNQSLK